MDWNESPSKRKIIHLHEDSETKIEIEKESFATISEQKTRNDLFQDIKPVALSPKESISELQAIQTNETRQSIGSPSVVRNVFNTAPSSPIRDEQPQEGASSSTVASAQDTRKHSEHTLTIPPRPTTKKQSPTSSLKNEENEDPNSSESNDSLNKAKSKARGKRKEETLTETPVNRISRRKQSYDNSDDELAMDTGLFS